MSWIGLFIVMVLAGTGCLPVVVGGLAVAGGAAGYAYYAGEMKREYEAAAVDVRLAARAALTDQGMVVMEEHSDSGGGWLVSKTAAGDRVSVTFADFPDPNAPTGFVTRVGVRVSAFGDPDFSRRLLDDVSARLGLAPPPSAAPAPNPNPVVPASRVVPKAAESAPPPLADKPPVADNRPADSPKWGPSRK
jgi:hypothetical protein